MRERRWPMNGPSRLWARQSGRRFRAPQRPRKVRTGPARFRGLSSHRGPTQGLNHTPTRLPMVADAQIKQWKKQRRQSVRHLGVTPFLVIGLVSLLALIRLFAPLPAWVMVILLAVPSLTILGDCINVA